jgi:RNA polymerase sigma factor (sigma-70 family)
MNPFSSTYDAAQDLALVKEAVEGSNVAMDKLVRQHQQFIYNVALKLVGNPDDAEDLCQEAIIKMITKLSQFKGKSSFRTWLYRIVFNHFINATKKTKEVKVVSFEEYGHFLGTAYLTEEMSPQEHKKYDEEIINVKNSCLSGMLLCLERQQRIVFILGAMFNINSRLAAQILNITAGNFRQQLSRAKTDLFSFMNNKCGLINPANPCRCEKKTKGYIKDGIIDPVNKQFTKKVLMEINQVAIENNSKLDSLLERKYLTLFKKQPYADKDLAKKLSKSLLFNKEVGDLFRLGDN